MTRKLYQEVSMPVLFLLALLFLCSPIVGEWQMFLRYDRNAVLSGELWRLFTSHLTHLEWAHWLGNAGGLVLLSMLSHGALTPMERVCALLVGFVGINAGLLLFVPSLTWYVGLSGALHGLALALAVAWIYQRDWMGYALLAGVTFKIISEMLWGPWSEGLLEHGRVAWEAHVFGYLSVLLWMLFYRPRLTRTPAET